MPANIGFISSPLLMFSAMITEPASPNTRASNAPVFISNFSRMAVSYLSSSYLYNNSFVTPFFSNSSKAKASFSSIYAAINGFSAILWTYFL